MAGSVPADPRGDGVWLEIGFGGGEHLAAQARDGPDVRVLGAEPFQNGAASALRHIDEAGPDQRAACTSGDARDLLAALPDACLERIFVHVPRPLAQGAPPEAAAGPARDGGSSSRGC